MTSGLRARIVQFVRLAAAPPWAAGAIILLGLAGAALEGAGLYLFMPLVGALIGGAVSGGIANHLVYRVLAPAPQRLFGAPPQRQASLINPLTALFHDVAFSRLKGRTRKLAFGAAAPLAAIGYAAHSARTRGAETAAAWIC